MSQTSKLMNHVLSSCRISRKTVSDDVCLPNKSFLTQSDSDFTPQGAFFSPQSCHFTVTTNIRLIV